MAVQDKKKSRGLWTSAMAELHQRRSSSVRPFPSRTPGLASQNKTQSFQLFGQLPSEIRLKIWRQALPPPRFIPTSSALTYHEDRIHGWDVMSKWYKNERKNTMSPKKARRIFYGVLQACKESRFEALKFYRILIAHPDALAAFQLPGWANPPYVNIYHDIFYVNWLYDDLENFNLISRVLQKAYGDQLAMIRTISTTEMIIRGPDRGDRTYSTIQRLFTGATHLILLFPPGDRSSYDGVIRVPLGGHAEAVSNEYQVMKAKHPEWKIQNVEVRDYDGTPLRTATGTDGQGMDLDVTYMNLRGV